MFGIPVSLIVYGVIALVVVGSVFGAIRSHDNGIRAKQKAEDQVLLVACQANEQTAKDANISLQASIEPIAAERDRQSKAVADWKLLADRAATVADDQMKANAPLLTRLAQAQREARAKAGRPAQAMTCEQTLAEIDADSKEFATQRAILFPPEARPDAMRVK